MLIQARGTVKALSDKSGASGSFHCCINVPADNLIYGIVQFVETPINIGYF
jgi:hypothetical protein